jgi:hypothetical protein
MVVREKNERKILNEIFIYILSDMKHEMGILMAWRVTSGRK